MSFIEFQRRLGPSAVHVFGAISLTYLLGFLGGFILDDGVASAYWGAALMTGWFLGREVEQLAPHLGWNDDAPAVSEEQLNRAMRQAVWPAAFAHLAATSVWLLLRIL